MGFVKWLCGLAQIRGLGSFGQFIWVICEGFMRSWRLFGEALWMWLEKCIVLQNWASEGPFWDLSYFFKKGGFGHTRYIIYEV